MTLNPWKNTGFDMPLLFPNFTAFTTGGGGGGPSPGAESSFSGDRTTRPVTSSASWPAGLYDSTNDTTYFGWVADGGPIVARVWAYDHAAGQFDPNGPTTIGNSGINNDDHGPVVLSQLSDGRLVAFWGSHNTNQLWAICSATAGVPDLTDWTVQTPIAGDFTYPKPVNIPNGSGGGTLYLFMRRTFGTELPLFLYSGTYTSGGALSLSLVSSIIEPSNSRVYAGEVRATDASSSADIELMFTVADTGDTFRRSVYYAKYITSTGAVENIDGTTSTASGALPVTALANYREFDTGTNDVGAVSWCRDGSGNLHVLHGNDSAASGSSFDIYHAVWNGSSWSTPTTPFSVIRKSSDGFIENWCSVPLSGASIEAWYPSGNTGSWSARGGDNMARKVYASSTWGSEETIVTGGGTYALGQATSILNADPDFRVLFGEVSQGIGATDAFAAKRYAYGDSDFLQWPTPNVSFWSDVMEQIEYVGTDSTTPTDLDVSFYAQSLTYRGGADIQSNRLSLDGSGDTVEVGSSGVDVRRMNFPGPFMVFVSKIKFASLSTEQALWTCHGGPGNRAILTQFQGNESPKQLRIALSSDGTSVTSVEGDWSPADTFTEYDIVYSRDSSNTVRIHAGTSGGALSLVASGTFSGAINASSSGEPATHGSYTLIQQPLDGTVGGYRIVDADMGITDADYTPAAQPWDTN